MHMKNPVVNALIHSLVLIAVLTVNALANILPINGLNTGEVSALYPSLFTPAGITFSIWSVIYLLLLAFVLWQWVRLRDTRTQEIYRRVSPHFILSSVFNYFLDFSLAFPLRVGIGNDYAGIFDHAYARLPQP